MPRTCIEVFIRCARAEMACLMVLWDGLGRAGRGGATPIRSCMRARKVVEALGYVTLARSP